MAKGSGGVSVRQAAHLGVTCPRVSCGPAEINVGGRKTVTGTSQETQWGSYENDICPIKILSNEGQSLEALSSLSLTVQVLEDGSPGHSGGELSQRGLGVPSSSRPGPLQGGSPVWKGLMLCLLPLWPRLHVTSSGEPPDHSLKVGSPLHSRQPLFQRPTGLFLPFVII